MRRSARSVARVVLVVCAVGGIAGAVAATSRAAEAAGPSATATISAPAAVPSSSAKKPRVYVGVYLSDVSNFDLKAGRFDADLQVWEKWVGAPEAPPLTFLNGQIDKQDEVAHEDDGQWRSVRWRVQGTFRGTFPLQQFPFDTQTLPIEIALSDRSKDLVPDLAGSGMTAQFSITGWIYEPYFRANEQPRTFASDFGSVLEEGQPETLDTVSFTVEMHRPLAAYSIKFMAPLAIIIAVAFLAFFVPPGELEVRSSLGVTALLSCVAFHFTQADSLPEVSYLVAADKLFIGAYAVVFLSLALSLVSYKLEEEHADRARRVDRTARTVLPIAAIAGAVFVVLLAPRGGRDAITVAPAATPGAGAVASAAKPQTPSRAELHVGVSTLPSLNMHGFYALLRRGMSFTDANGDRHPFLATVVPAMTNDRVRFLPDGGMTVRWELRDDARFSDGAPITSDDIAFCLSMREEPTRAEIRIVDSSNVEVRYTARPPSALDDFIVGPKRLLQPVFEKGGSSAVTDYLRTTPPPGDGPYVLDHFDANKEAVFTRNPYFLGEKPRIEKLVFKPYETSVALADALKKGEIDFAPTISVSGLDALHGAAGIETRITPTDLLHFLQPDLHAKPFDDLRVRQALLYAIDREGLAEDIYGKGGVVADSYRPADADDFATDVPHVTRDPAKARALLAEAGVPVPFPITLFSPDAPPGTPHMKGMERLVANLNESGFQVKFELLKKDALKTFTDGKHGGVMFYLRRDTATADRIWNLPTVNGHVTSDVPTALFDATDVALWKRYRATLFEERRQVLSRELQKHWLATLPLIPLFFGADQSAWRDELHGFAPGKTDTVWWNVETWSIDDGTATKPSVATDGK